MKGIVMRISQLDRRIGVLLVGVFFVLVFGGAALVMSALGGDEVDSPGEDVLVEDVLILSSEVEARVLATIEAIPTLAPTPTPDIAATLAAERATNRGEVDLAFVLNPLEVDTELRNPYLRKEEYEYLRDVGERVWHYTKIWLHVREVVSVDTTLWDISLLEYQVGTAQILLEEAPERVDPAAGLRPVIRAYVDHLEVGMTSIRSAVTRVAEAEAVLASGGTDAHEGRAELLAIVHDVELMLVEFEQAMSRYGCSVCGELYRIQSR